jgi:hypothetical protein
VVYKISKVLNFLAKTDIKLKKLKTFQTKVIHEMEQCDATSRIQFFLLDSLVGS